MFASPTIIERGNSITVKYGNDESTYPVFSVEAQKDEEASIAEGREIFKDVEWITIHFAGDNLKKVSRPATDEDKMRFPRHYEAFKSQGIQLQEGTPLTEWSLVSKAMALNLKSMNIHTVEQLAACSDGNLGFMGGRELQKKAIAWLENAKGNGAISQLQSENEELKRNLQAMQKQIDALAKKPEKEK